MLSSKTAVMLVAGLIGITSTSHAQQSVQSSTVTFRVPLNLTRLAASITRVAVNCIVSPGPRAITARAEFPVTAGQVVYPAEVVMDLSSAGFRPGDRVSYECTLLGFSSGTATNSAITTGWATFDARNGPAYAVSPTPTPITNSFEW